MAKLDDLHKQWDELDRIKVFEIQAIDKRTKEQEWLLFDISLVGEKFIAEHDSFTEAEERSLKIAHEWCLVDTDVSMDENLEYLHEKCIEAIIGSDFYELSNNQ